MYARVTNFKVDPSRLPELSAKIKEMGPRAKALPGMVDAYAAWRADGQGVRGGDLSEQGGGRRGRSPGSQAIWGSLAGLLSGAPRTDAYENAAHITG